MCVVCVCDLWPPVSLVCQNYDVVGFQPQAAANPFLGSVHPLSYIFNPPNYKVCMPETNEQRTENGYIFFFHPSILLSPTKYNNNNMRQMIQIIYRDEWGTIGGTWYAIIS